MEVPGRSQAPPHGYSLVSDGDHYDFRGLRNEAKMRSMLKMDSWLSLVNGILRAPSAVISYETKRRREKKANTWEGQ